MRFFGLTTKMIIEEGLEQVIHLAHLDYALDINRSQGLRPLCHHVEHSG